MKLLIAVFSYNRGIFLENCIRSVEQCIKCDYEIVIYDDHSNDDETIDVLNGIGRRYRVLKTLTGGFVDKKVSGLYANLNNALDLAIQSETDLLFALQDDMQIVRLVREDVFRAVKTSMVKLKGLGAVVPTFYKMNHKKNYNDLLRYDFDTELYVPVNNRQVYMTGVADTGLLNVQLLRDVNWRFDGSEELNMAKGRDLELIRGIYRYPFVSYLPWPRAIRKNRGIGKQVYDIALNAFYKTGFHPLDIMSEEACDRLYNRPIEDYPFAEDYLELKESYDIKKPWNYYHPAFEFRRSVGSVVNAFRAR